MPNHHPYTPSPSELPGLLSGEVTEVWVEMEVQPEGVCPDGIAYARSTSMLDDCFDDLYEVTPPYAVGDVLVVCVQVSEHHRAYNRNTLAITAVTPQQRDGVWGFAYEVATTKGIDDE